MAPAGALRALAISALVASAEIQPMPSTTAVDRYFSFELANAVGDGMCEGSPVFDELIVQFATEGSSGIPALPNRRY
jgi:hypothetical protein